MPNAWDYVQPWDIERFGEVILDEKERRRWASAFGIAGGLPYMWQVLAAPMKQFIYGQLEPRPGDKVLVIGEALEPCGFLDDIRKRIGPEGKIQSFEIIEEARQKVFANQKGANGKLGTWRYTYTDNVPDGYFDCVAIMQGVQHTESWKVTAPEMLRVMKSGRRIVLAEIGFGAEYKSRLQSDLHIWALHDRLRGSNTGRTLDDFSYYSPEELLEAFDGLVEEPGTFSWKGLDIFWGRKP